MIGKTAIRRKKSIKMIMTASTPSPPNLAVVGGTAVTSFAQDSVKSETCGIPPILLCKLMVITCIRWGQGEGGRGCKDQDRSWSGWGWQRVIERANERAEDRNRNRAIPNTYRNWYS